jgi:hypothetical protein
MRRPNRRCNGPGGPHRQGVDQSQLNWIASPTLRVACFQSAAALSQSDFVTMHVALNPSPDCSPLYSAHLFDDRGKIGEMS